MVLGSALALTVAGYVSLTLTLLRNSSRTFHYNTAFNLAESGLEEALWALNKNDWSQRNWTNPNSSDKLLTGTYSSSELTATSTKGYFNVLVENFNNVGGTPIITAEGVVQPPNGPAIRKQIRVYAKQSNLFLPPFTAITKLTLNGGEIDSYTMASGDYSTAPRLYNTTVASPTVTIGNISIGSPADIYGYVTVGVAAASSGTYASSVKGSIQGPATTAGQPGVLNAGGNLVDTNRIAYDFTQTFPMPTAPTGVFADPVPAVDSNNLVILGDPTGATTKRYQFTNYSVPNKATVLVVGPVEIKVTGNWSMSGQESFTVLRGSFTTPSTTVTTGTGKNKVTTTIPGTTYPGTNASATMYAYGDVSISGNGAMTGGTIPGSNISTDPTKLIVYGMSTTSQNITVGGNGNLAAAVYAPHADATFNGGGSSGCFAGAMVADRITVNGQGYRVRYPEEMNNMSSSSTYQISGWRELLNLADQHTF
jgi:hypothetical protein